MKELKIEFAPAGIETPLAFFLHIKLKRKRLDGMSPEAKEILLKELNQAIATLATWKNEVITHY